MMVEINEKELKYEGFLKWGYPTTMGFPTKNDHFGMFPKIGGFPHKSSHFNRVFHYSNHPFWGTPIFGNT